MIDTPKDEHIYITCNRYIDKSFPIESYEFFEHVLNVENFNTKYLNN